jgi:AhpD family alkylhydroperoxidase
MLSSVAGAIVATLTCSIALWAQDPQQSKPAAGNAPSFVKYLPDEGAQAAWDEMSAIQMSPDTALPAMAKELIGLGVAAQVPCRYCIYAHTQFAKHAGAGDREIREAIAVAAITRHWSAVANGMQIDQAVFDKENQQIFAYLKKGPQQGQGQPVTDAQSAYKDIERTLGTVPTFLRQFPQAGIAAAWREMKSIELNPQTALPAKIKDLIAVAVSAQIPCKYCVAFHTGAARLDGASDEEIKEAVAMAALTRHWSTVINGAMPDEAQFRREIDQLVKQMPKPEAKQPPSQPHAQR